MSRSVDKGHFNAVAVPFDGETSLVGEYGDAPVLLDPVVIEKRIPVVPLPDCVFNIVKDKEPDAFLVVTDSGAPMNKDSYKRRSKRLKREMDIIMGAKMFRNEITESKLGDFVPYDLRHDYCSRLQGTDIRITQYLMGHSSITLMDVYSHINEKDIATNAEKILASTTGVLPQR